MYELTVGSLFSGIGGLDLGFEREGYRIRWMIEINEFCQQILRKNWPYTTLLADVTAVNPDILPPVDVLTGGFPCQDISEAGKRAGLDGDRSGLWFTYLKYIRSIQPEYVVIENVTALLRRGMDTVLAGLAESGYDAEWQCLTARAFGARHKRDRIFIVAYPGRELAHSSSAGLQGWPEQKMGWEAYCSTTGLPRIFRSEGERPGVVQWEDPPNVARMANGVPNTMDRTKALGGAVVPYVSQYIARLIKDDYERRCQFGSRTLSEGHKFAKATLAGR